jgi:glycosyltransferase involved in cell wall biosynthesis
MTIGLVSTAVGMGGAERYLIELADWLADAGFKPFLLVPREIAGECRRSLKRQDVAVVASDIEWAWGAEDNKGGEEYFSKVERQRKSFLQSIEEIPEKPTSFFLNANWPTHYIGVMQASLEQNIPFSIHFHLCPHQIYLSPEARALHEVVMSRASLLTCVSLNNRCFLELTFGPMHEFQIVRNGSRFEISEAEKVALLKEPRRNDLLLVGRLDYQKGIIDILPALSEAGDLFGWHVHILGEGPLSSALTSAMRCLNAPVSLHGGVDDVRKWFTSSGAMLLPSHYEGLSLSILEAMSLGCVPITSRASSANEIIVDGETGFLFDVGDWRSMICAVRRFMASDQERIRSACLAQGRLLSRTAMFSEMQRLLFNTFQYV